MQPVHLLRAQVAKWLLAGHRLDDERLEEFKNQIRKKDKKMLATYPENVVSDFVGYYIGRHDIFKNWQKPWVIFHPFFYRDTVKKTVKMYLAQLAELLYDDLSLQDYTIQNIDFAGPNSFGRNFCSLVFYPESKNAANEAHQFHVNLGASPEAGRVSGRYVSAAKGNELHFVHSYEAILAVLKAQKSNITRYNEDDKRHFFTTQTPNLYSIATDKAFPFIEEKNFLEAVNVLKRKKNIILQGAPGVGKTFLAHRLAYQLMGVVEQTSITTVQFHASYTYEEFVQSSEKQGIFYKFCEKARKNAEKSHFFILDEINRGDVAKIFGELLLLIETDKRDKMAIPLLYAQENDPLFTIPNNVYIIGTMNSGDRSAAIFDPALRRRFAFFTLEPLFNVPFQAFLQKKGISFGLITHLCHVIPKINQLIRNDVGLGAGYQIGHSYFCTDLDGQSEQDWWHNIVHFELRPLLAELWFDNPQEVERLGKMLEEK
jgi:5-methylcytosine-specific restriction protein B